MHLINSVDEIKHNIMKFIEFNSKHGTSLNGSFYRDTLKSGKCFVAMKTEHGYVMANSKFVGYANNSIESYKKYTKNRNGGSSNTAIEKILGALIVFGDPGFSDLFNIYNDLLEESGKAPSKKKGGKKFWILNDLVSEVTEESDINNLGKEGTKMVLVNKYERDPMKRAECIEAFKPIYACQICEFSFKTMYGEIGDKFIHVHHIVPVSETDGEQRNIDPKVDLIPVCPNCHAMLHNKLTGLLNPDELRTRIQAIKKPTKNEFGGWNSS